MSKLRKNENCAPECSWLQITAGQGPKECGWVVAQVLRKIAVASSTLSLKLEIVEWLAFDRRFCHENPLDVQAFRSILIRLEGKGAEAFAKSWHGTVKWQGASPYRPKHRRCNWFVGVEVNLVSQEASISTERLVQEVKIETMHSSGPGGQHVNTTNSAVRVDSDRSQHRNRKLALERLQLLLSRGVNEKNKKLKRDRWLNHYQVERGNPHRVYYGVKFHE